MKFHDQRPQPSVHRQRPHGGATKLHGSFTRGSLGMASYGWGMWRLKSTGEVLANPDHTWEWTLKPPLH